MTNMPAHRSAADYTAADCTAAYHGPAENPANIRPMESTGLVRSDAAALADLQMHWGSVYEIGLDGDIWFASFRGTADELRARTCLELRTLIRADYSYRQQAGHTRREPRPGTDGEDGEGGEDGECAGEPPQTSYGHPPIGGERMSL